MATLTAVLAGLSLDSFASTLEEEELTLETLRWMATDEDGEFVA